MRKRGLAILTAAALLMGTLAACGTEESASPENALQGVRDEAQETDGGQGEAAGETESGASADEAGDGQAAGELFADGIEVRVRDAEVVPAAAPYEVAADLSNIDNLWQFGDWLAEGAQGDMLARQGFCIVGDTGAEFFEQYEWNRYEQIASFVTVDSLMHTYHLYFSYLLKGIERDYLAERVTELSGRLLEDSLAYYEEMQGTAWEDAAARNVAFFTVGAKLLDDTVEIPDCASETAIYELEHIERAEGIADSALTGMMEDYTQYIPRGYYEGDELLEAYFRAMMWYGRCLFRQEDEERDRSALLITQMLSEDEEAYALWQSVYEVTAFFTGASEDPGVNEYLPILREAYGDGVSVGGLAEDEAAFALFHRKTGELPPPQIYTVPVWEGEENVIPGFRFMGQRFTVDAAVMQRLIYRSVLENSRGQRRMLPDALDVPAALGSDIALQILEEQGDTDYENYAAHMEELQGTLSRENEELWSASLYAGWLNTLRPLLEVKGEGYPTFMQGEQWAKKDLECFAGSYAELKHDTILYTKQVMAEMGGDGWEQEPDDRGYAEPEPVVYARFAELADRTAAGLQKYGMLTVDAQEDLARLAQIADTLLEISKKELRDETLTEEEYEFIRGYGGSIEHFWTEAVSGNGEESVSTMECPAAVVADIATDPNGEVLEVGTGSPSLIRVIVRVDGKLKIAQGSAYSFYQFSWPMEERLTDEKWRQMLGIMPNEEGMYEPADLSDMKPAWTMGYRVE